MSVTDRMNNQRHRLHHALSLVFTGTTGPQGKERRDRLVSTLPLLLGVIVKVERLPFVPAVLVDLLLPEGGSSVPFLRGLLPRGGFLSLASVSFTGDGEGRQVEIVFQIELVPEDVSDRRSNIVLVLHKETRIA